MLEELGGGGFCQEHPYQLVKCKESHCEGSQRPKQCPANFPQVPLGKASLRGRGAFHQKIFCRGREGASRFPLPESPGACAQR